MCSPTDHVVEGILKYSLIPYAEQNNIEIRDLIKKLSDYHRSIDKEKPPCENTETAKRGRPVGSKNKEKTNNITLKIKRPRGRPKGSTKKTFKELNFNND